MKSKDGTVPKMKEGGAGDGQSSVGWQRLFQGFGCVWRKVVVVKSKATILRSSGTGCGVYDDDVRFLTHAGAC